MISCFFNALFVLEKSDQFGERYDVMTKTVKIYRFGYALISGTIQYERDLTRLILLCFFFFHNNHARRANQIRRCNQISQLDLQSLVSSKSTALNPVFVLLNKSVCGWCQATALHSPWRECRVRRRISTSGIHTSSVWKSVKGRCQRDALVTSFNNSSSI
jgi:hypothetical protein